MLDVDRLALDGEATQHQLGVLAGEHACQPRGLCVALDRTGAGVDDRSAAGTGLDVDDHVRVADADAPLPRMRARIGVAVERACQGAPHLERRHVDLQV